jgi:hypothetical protein
MQLANLIISRQAALDRESERTNLQLANYLLVEIFRSCIRPEGNEIASVDMFFLDAPLTLLDASHSLLF